MLGIVESTGAEVGRVDWFESITGPPFLNLPVNGAVYTVGSISATAPARYRVGRIFFVANASAITDGSDIFSGLFSTGFDAILDGIGFSIPASRLSFGTASLNAIPEPETVSLLGLGLLGLALAARVSRR